MCGIIGYLGKKQALPLLLDGLKNLEYRGYDSAGIMVFDGSDAKIEKVAGRVTLLEEKVAKNISGFQGTVGIAHTRWATHGRITKENAHPHWDCQENIYLCHNGIIENYQELKDDLIKKSHTFRSETDTEVLVHLIEEAKKNQMVTTLEEAVRAALAKVQGTYGIVVVDKREPKKIVAARNFSPLLVGIGKDEFVVASDAAAVARLTDNVIYLHDGEIAVLGPASYRIFTIGNVFVRRKAEQLEWNEAASGKGRYPHFMLKEIHEQPEAIRSTIRGRLIVREGRANLGGLREVQDKLRHTERILIAACGTAYFAGKVGEYMLEEYAGIPTEIELGSEFRYRKPIFKDGDIFLAISQSGETADTLGALQEAKKKGILSLGIVNVVGSSISRETDAGIYEHIGPEISVPSTKSFTAQVSILALLALYFGRDRTLSLEMGKRIAKGIQEIPSLIEKILRKERDLEGLASAYQAYKNFYFLGRKYNYPIALEGALKLKEISYVHAEGYGAGEMKHGPIALIDKNFPSIVIAPQDSVYDKMISNIEEIKTRGGPVFAIATEGDKKIAKLADHVFYIPKTLEMLTPLLTVVPLQLFAYYFGVMRGVDVDKPRNLAKSVTVE